MMVTTKTDNDDAKKKKKNLLSVCLGHFTGCYRECGHKIHVLKPKKRKV